jgi:hypothetical protein
MGDYHGPIPGYLNSRPTENCLPKCEHRPDCRTKREISAWEVYNDEARKVDIELVKDWTASLNFLLVFVSHVNLHAL